MIRYLKKNKIKREKEKQIKSEIDLQKLKDELDMGEVTKELEFYFGSLNKFFFYACQNLKTIHLSLIFYPLTLVHTYLEKILC